MNFFGCCMKQNHVKHIVSQEATPMRPFVLALGVVADSEDGQQKATVFVADALQQDASATLAKVLQDAGWRVVGTQVRGLSVPAFFHPISSSCAFSPASKSSADPGNQTYSRLGYSTRGSCGHGEDAEDGAWRAVADAARRRFITFLISFGLLGKVRCTLGEIEPIFPPKLTSPFPLPVLPNPPPRCKLC
jgi:hypothetical protein